MPYEIAIQQLPRACLISEGFNQRTIECDTFQYMIEGIVSLETYCHELASMLHNISTHSASLDNTCGLHQTLRHSISFWEVVDFVYSRSHRFCRSSTPTLVSGEKVCQHR
jgi:hypothetical protein